MTYEPILLPVVPYSEGCEFPSQIEKYRRIVEEALFDRLGRPSFFDEAVEMVMGRIAARIEGEQNSETANGKSTSCAFAPQLSREGKVNDQSMPSRTPMSWKPTGTEGIRI